MTEFVAPLLDATVRTATPLALAAVGETVCERAGVINVGLEGAIMAGCLGAAAGAVAFGTSAGLAAAAASGVLVAVIFGFVVLVARADQIIAGTAITLGAYGATALIARLHFGPGGVSLRIPTPTPLELPGASAIPVVGPALFTQPVFTWLLYAATMLAWWWMYRTHAGLALRATGERPAAALAAGISVRRMQWIGILAGGACGGLAGAALVMQSGTFAEQMSAGRGFIALAVVALGRWSPQGAFAAALLFGGATAVQYRLQAGDSTLPYQLPLALPYALTLLVLAGGLGRSRAPAALGRVDEAAA